MLTIMPQGRATGERRAIAAMRALALRLASRAGRRGAASARRRRTGRPSGRRGRCRRATSSSRPTRSRRCANGLQVVAVLAPRAAGGEHAAAGARRRRAGSRRTSRASPRSRRRCSIRARRRKSAEEIADAIDFIGGAMGAGAGTDLTLRQHGRDEGQLRRRRCDMLSDMAQHPAFAPEEIERQRQQMLSGCRSATRIPDYLANRSSIGWSTASIPTACRRPARRRRSPRITRDDLVAFHKK